MQLIRSIDELKNALSNLDKTIGYVPTMGALHDGHRSLIKKAKEQNEFCIVSDFVNPSQFLPNEDLENYPRNESEDIKTCESCGVDVLFMPSSDEMYPSNDVKIIAPTSLSTKLEGATRPGHFDGVLTVLNKFFNLISPNRVYFGKKDAQQLLIVQKMIKTTFKNIELIPCDIVRGADGLALSSRNSYLDEEEKLEALKLYRALLKANELIKNGEFSTKVIKEQMRAVLEPIKIDYVEITDRELNSVEKVTMENTLILIAAYIGKTRLIDNLWI